MSNRRIRKSALVARLRPKGPIGTLASNSVKYAALAGIALFAGSHLIGIMGNGSHAGRYLDPPSPQRGEGARRASERAAANLGAHHPLGPNPSPPSGEGQPSLRPAPPQQPLPPAALPPAPAENRLRAIVGELASPAYQGRRGAGGKKAADYLVGQFRQLKLDPLFNGDFAQPIPGTEPGTVQGRNVGAMLRGSDPKLSGQWVILAAHFDHLGVRNGRLYPGADDNASGVAMMLEVARSIVDAPTRPERSVMFLGFDLEEVGLFGSRYFVAHSPIPIERVSLFITADMISRALGGICEKHVFVMGTEHAPSLRPWIDEAARGRPLTVGLLGADLLLINRSDYGPFRALNVPFLFFTTGENPRYHTPDDGPDTLDYGKLAEISQVIHRVVVHAVTEPSLPRWQSNPDNPFAEALTIRDVLRLLAKNSSRLRISQVSLFVINSTLHSLDEIAKRGSITPEERARVIQAARVVLIAVF
jgi:hypothetical protein